MVVLAKVLPSAPGVSPCHAEFDQVDVDAGFGQPERGDAAAVSGTDDERRDSGGVGDRTFRVSGPAEGRGSVDRTSSSYGETA